MSVVRRAGATSTPSVSPATTTSAWIVSSSSVPVTDSWSPCSCRRRLLSSGSLRVVAARPATPRASASTSRSQRNLTSDASPRWVDRKLGSGDKACGLGTTRSPVHVRPAGDVSAVVHSLPQGRWGADDGRWTSRCCPPLARRLPQVRPPLVSTSVTGAGLEALGELYDLVVHLLAFSHQLLDLLERVDDRGVVPSAELPGDGGERQVGLIPHHVHADLTSRDQRALAALALQGIDGEAEVVRSDLEHAIGREGLLLGLLQEVDQQPLGDLDGDRYLVQAGVGRHPDQGALELADVRRDTGGDELEHLGRHPAVVPLGLVAQDGEPCLEVGRLDVGDEAPLEPAPQAVFERLDGVGCAVGGDDDLLVRSVQRVEGVEELLLEAFLALHELDVVDEQDVHVAVAALEEPGGVLPDGVDVLVQEVLGGHVAHGVVGVVLVDVVPDGVEQVGLAQAGLAVDEQRVVRAGRRLRDPQRGGQRELVGRPLHEGLERVLAVQTPRGARWSRGFASDGRGGSVGARAVRALVEDGVVGAALGPDDHIHDEVRLGALVDGALDEREVRTFDPLPDLGAGNTQCERRIDELESSCVLERGEPHGLRDLPLEDVAHLVPQVFGIVHLLFRLLSWRGVHNHIHTLWTTNGSNGLRSVTTRL